MPLLENSHWPKLKKKLTKIKLKEKIASRVALLRTENDKRLK